MTKASVNKGKTLKLSALILSIGALVIAGGIGCASDRYAHSTVDNADSSRVRATSASEAAGSRDMGLQTSPTSPIGSPNGSLGF